MCPVDAERSGEIFFYRNLWRGTWAVRVVFDTSRVSRSDKDFLQRC